VSAIPALRQVRGRTGRAVGSDVETGLIYMRQRWYDSSLGRFISRDPIGLRGGVNVYRYTENQPNNLVDPFGLKGGNGASVLDFSMSNDVLPGGYGPPIWIPQAERPGGYCSLQSDKYFDSDFCEDAPKHYCVYTCWYTGGWFDTRKEWSNGPCRPYILFSKNLIDLSSDGSRDHLKTLFDPDRNRARQLYHH